MPELPEVETVARQLAQSITGAKIEKISIHDAKLFPVYKNLRSVPRLKGWVIDRVFRSGKQVVWELRPPESTEKANKWLVVHLRMTGRLIRESNRKRFTKQKKSRADFVLSDSIVGFYDTRRFGTISIVDDPDSFRPSGVEPLDKSLTFDQFKKLVNGSRQDAKAWLLRQDKLVGLGNIYVCEALFRSKIDPRRMMESLDDAELKRLLKSIRMILKKAIANCGTTFSDFQDSTGSVGHFRKFLNVYDREGEHCKMCSSEIKRIKQAGRSSYYCPDCQI